MTAFLAIEHGKFTVTINGRQRSTVTTSRGLDRVLFAAAKRAGVNPENVIILCSSSVDSIENRELAKKIVPCTW